MTASSYVEECNTASPADANAIVDAIFTMGDVSSYGAHGGTQGDHIQQHVIVKIAHLADKHPMARLTGKQLLIWLVLWSTGFS